MGVDAHAPFPAATLEEDKEEEDKEDDTLANSPLDAVFGLLFTLPVFPGIISPVLHLLMVVNRRAALAGLAVFLLDSLGVEEALPGPLMHPFIRVGWLVELTLLLLRVE